MRHSVIPVIAAFLFLAAGAPASAEEKPGAEFLEGGRKIIWCVPVKTAPIIDGNLNDPCWKDAFDGTGFLHYSGKGFVSQKTVFRAAYDKENLYIAAECFEDRTDKLSIRQTERNINLWQDDSVEFFIDPNRTEKVFTYFAANAKGVPYDTLGGVCTWTCRTRIEKDRWTIEAAIPFNDLGTPAPGPGTVWGFNIAREERPHDEISSWNYSPSSLWQPKQFGDLVFGEPPPVLPVFVRQNRDNFTGKADFAFILKNRTAQKQRSSIRFSLSDKAKTVLHSQACPLEANEEKTFQTRISYSGNAEGDIRFELDPGAASSYAMTAGRKRNESVLGCSVWPFEFTDFKTEFICGQANFAWFAFGNSGKTPLPFEFILECPDNIGVTDPSERLKNRKFSDRYGLQYVPKPMRSESASPGVRRYIIEFKKPLLPCELDKVSNYCLMPFCFIPGEKDAGKTIGMKFFLRSGGIVSEKRSFTVRMLPPFPARSPEKILICPFDWFVNMGASAAEQQAILKTYRDCGANALIPGDNKDPDLYPAAKKQGISIHNCLWWYWWDKEYLAKHPEAKMLDDKGQPYKAGGIQAVCPTVLIHNPEAFRNTADMIAGRMAYADGIWYDLEGPNSFDGCFCPRCIGEFRKFAKIKTKFPLNPMFIKARYRKQWLDFATWQTAEILGKIHAAAKAAKPESLFNVYAGLPSDYTMVTGRCDWKKAAKAIDITGPSMYYMIPSGLAGLPGEIRSFVRMTGNENPMLRQGAWLRTGSLRGVEGIYHTYPRILKIEMLLFAACGLKDGMYFWFGENMTGGVRRAVAEASTILAENEKIILTGRRDASLVRVTAPDGGKFTWEVVTGEKEALLFLFNFDPEKSVRLKIGSSAFPENLWHFTVTGTKAVPSSLNGLTLEVPPLETEIIRIVKK